MYLVVLNDIQEAGVSTPYGAAHWPAVVPEWADDGPMWARAAPKRLPDRAFTAR
jgi:hypothetical protein